MDGENGRFSFMNLSKSLVHKNTKAVYVTDAVLQFHFYDEYTGKLMLYFHI